MIQARTAYNVPILARAFATADQAIHWAERQGGKHLFPGLRIVRVAGEDQTVTLWQEANNDHPR